MNEIEAADHYSSPTAEASVFPYGATIASWIPAGQRPVLWLSRLAVFADGKAIRGGVPVCFPWFNQGPAGGRLPSHGLARLSQWKRGEVTERNDRTIATYCLCSDQASEAGAFDGDYRVDYRMEFGTDMELTLTVTNTGEETIEIEEALHTYLAVSDVRQVRVEGLDGAPYFCNVAKDNLVQRGVVTFDGEFDRVYDTREAIEVIDPAWNRILRITRTESADSIIWNPWAESARRLSDFGDDEWTGMLCVEGGNVREHALTLTPGRSHSMGYRVEVRPL